MKGTNRGLLLLGSLARSTRRLVNQTKERRETSSILRLDVSTGGLSGSRAIPEPGRGGLENGGFGLTPKKTKKDQARECEEKNERRKTNKKKNKKKKEGTKKRKKKRAVPMSKIWFFLREQEKKETKKGGGPA